MASSDRIMGLSKYIVTLPGSTFSVASMVVLSFVLGAIVSALQPSDQSLNFIQYCIWWCCRIFNIWFNIYNEWCCNSTNDQHP